VLVPSPNQAESILCSELRARFSWSINSVAKFKRSKAVFLGDASCKSLPLLSNNNQDLKLVQTVESSSWLEEGFLGWSMTTQGLPFHLVGQGKE